jgi:hypothetical protein
MNPRGPLKTSFGNPDAAVVPAAATCATVVACVRVRMHLIKTALAASWFGDPGV